MSTLRMEKNFTRLIRLSAALRNPKTLQHHKLVKESTQYMSYDHSTNVKDATETENSKLCNTLPLKLLPFDSNQPMTILNKVCSKELLLEPKSALSILNFLRKMEKANKLSKSEVKGHTGFFTLCKILQKNMRLLEPTDIISLLYAFVELNMSPNSLIYQSVLQYLRVCINGLNIQQLSFIQYLLHKQNSENALFNALSTAVPIVLQTQFKSQTQKQSLKHLMSIMKFAPSILRSNQIELLYTMLLEKIKKTENIVCKYGVPSLALIYTSMISIGQFNSHISIELMQCIEKLISENVNKVSNNSMTYMLHMLSVFLTEKTPDSSIYNEAFIDKLIGEIILRDVTFKKLMDILLFLNSIRHVSIPLLDYIAAKCFKDKSLLKTHFYATIILLNGLVIADYKPVFWNSIANDILRIEHIYKYTDISFLRMTANLVALDVYDSCIIQKALSIQPQDNNQLLWLNIIYQTVKVMYPSYEGPWPNEEQFKSLKFRKYMILNTLTREMYNFLKEMLQEALGGEQYVYTNLTTKLGHQIDFAIVMRKGGYPIAINVEKENNTSNTEIENIKCPPGSQIILLYIMPKFAYSRNTERLKGTWLLTLRSAEALIGCSSIALNGEWWYKLPAHEKIPYLMQAIKLKCND